MRSLHGHRCAFILLGVMSAATAGCSTPLTDISSTSSESVGPWAVAHAKVNGDQLTANVCMQNSESADAISDRLLLQLRNKGYQRIALSMYAPSEEGAQQRQVTWSTREGKQMQPATQVGQNPCEARDAATEPVGQAH